VSALGILPIDQDRFEIFVRAGMLFADQTLKGDLGVARGVELENEQDLWLIGAGLAFRPASQWSARLEYQAVDELRANTMTGSIRMWRISLGVVRQF
jgi:opacity protein-like surface antigen